MEGTQKLGPALRLADEKSGCSLVFTEAVLSEPIPRIFVVHTDPAHTLVALKAAAKWTDELTFGIELIVALVAPYPMPISMPPVSVDFALAEMRRMVADSGVHADVHVYVCRDAFHVLSEVLPAQSTVVLGVKKTWWPSASLRLGRKLNKLGHLTIFAE
jgi:hypothetical protein